jgi:hypothetical protein
MKQVEAKNRNISAHGRNSAVQMVDNKWMERSMKIILMVVILSSAGRIFGAPVMEESKISMPEVQYELPEALIGEFIMVSPSYDHEITIYPNNKFILWLTVPLHTREQTYGYIIKIDNAWYFSLAPESRKNYFRQDLTEIHLTDSGFSYSTEWTGLLRSMRKEDFPAPKQLAQDISVPNRAAKQQYFSFSNSGADKVEYNEIDTLPDSYYKNSQFIMHYLQIDNGIVKITRKLSAGADSADVFNGFLEITAESSNALRGIIRFTNGLPYYYIEDGTAEIEINNDGSIKITMLYTPEQIEARPIPESFKFPAKFIREF